MINNQDAGDISGLEEVFRSQEFGRASGTAADGPGGVGLSVRRGEGILGTRFGRRPVAAPGLRTGDDAGSRRTSDAVGPPVAGAERGPGAKQPSSVPASDAGAALGRGPPTILLRRVERHSSRYWTIASVSALVALVAAGITAGTGQHPRVACRRPRTTREVTARWWAQHLRCGVNGLGGSGWLARRRGRLRRPFVDRGHERRTWFRQRARWTRHPYWAGDLHRRSGLASGAVGWRSERGWRRLRVRRRPRAPIRPLPSRPPSGAR